MANTNYRAGGYDIGKKHDASLITPGAATPQDDVVRDNVVVADPADPLAVAAVKNSAPVGTEYGLLVRTVGGGGGGGGPATIADGADVAEGATTDAAVIGDVAGTVSAKLRGLSKILNSVWDSVNSLLHINIKQYGGTAVSLGQKPAATCLPVVLSSDTIHTVSLFPDITVNLDQVGGVAITEGQKAMAASVPVVIASDQTAVPISAASLPLPAGAATEATLATRLADATFTGRINTQGQKAMAASTPVVIASDQSAVLVSGIVTANQGTLAAASTRSDTYTVPGSGVAVNVASGVKSFAIQVKSTGAVATSWDVRLEGSLDGVNWSTILQHTNVTGDGAVVWSGATLAPSLFYRSRSAGLVLGAATNIVVTIMGV